jgi:hypothetical protein
VPLPAACLNRRGMIGYKIPLRLQRNSRCSYDCALVRFLSKQDQMMTSRCSVLKAIRQAKANRFLPAVPYGRHNVERPCDGDMLKQSAVIFPSQHIGSIGIVR